LGEGGHSAAHGRGAHASVCCRSSGSSALIRHCRSFWEPQGTPQRSIRNTGAGYWTRSPARGGDPKRSATLGLCFQVMANPSRGSSKEAFSQSGELPGFPESPQPRPCAAGRSSWKSCRRLVLEVADLHRWSPGFSGENSQNPAVDLRPASLSTFAIGKTAIRVGTCSFPEG
jgi:hypothetical protein